MTYTKKVLMRMKKTELLATADAEGADVSSLEKVTKETIADLILKTVPVVSRPSQPKRLPHEDPPDGVSARIKRIRDQN
jgi:hypothetical protein